MIFNLVDRSSFCGTPRFSFSSLWQIIFFLPIAPFDDAGLNKSPHGLKKKHFGSFLLKIKILQIHSKVTVVKRSLFLNLKNVWVEFLTIRWASSFIVKNLAKVYPSRYRLPMVWYFNHCFCNCLLYWAKKYKWEKSNQTRSAAKVCQRFRNHTHNT